MTPHFPDRRHAGRALGALLAERDFEDPIILGLPRGGVPVAYEVAGRLGAPLDIFTVRKLGVPRHPEFAMGAIATGGIRVLLDEVVRQLRISEATIDAVTAAERGELDRRERDYREARPFPSLRGRTVVLVDDGVATGASMAAAIESVRAHGPARIIAAAPVMSVEAHGFVREHAGDCEAVVVSDRLTSVGEWYGDFAQVSDREVRHLLHDAYVRHAITRRPALDRIVEPT